MKDKKRAMGRGLGAILSAESKATINSATDEGADKFVGNIVEIALEDIFQAPLHITALEGLLINWICSKVPLELNLCCTIPLEKVVFQQLPAISELFKAINCSLSKAIAEPEKLTMKTLA